MISSSSATYHSLATGLWSSHVFLCLSYHLFVRFCCDCGCCRCSSLCIGCFFFLFGECRSRTIRPRSTKKRAILSRTSSRSRKCSGRAARTSGASWKRNKKLSRKVREVMGALFHDLEPKERWNVKVWVKNVKDGPIVPFFTIISCCSCVDSPGCCVHFTPKCLCKAEVGKYACFCWIKNGYHTTRRLCLVLHVRAKHTCLN